MTSFLTLICILLVFAGMFGGAVAAVHSYVLGLKLACLAMVVGLLGFPLIFYFLGGK